MCEIKDRMNAVAKFIRSKAEQWKGGEPFPGVTYEEIKAAVNTNPRNPVNPYGTLMNLLNMPEWKIERNKLPDGDRFRPSTKAPPSLPPLPEKIVLERPNGLRQKQAIAFLKNNGGSATLDSITTYFCTILPHPRNTVRHNLRKGSLRSLVEQKVITVEGEVYTLTEIPSRVKLTPAGCEPKRKPRSPRKEERIASYAR
jgi:hypothetical protein